MPSASAVYACHMPDRRMCRPPALQGSRAIQVWDFDPGGVRQTALCTKSAESRRCVACPGKKPCCGLVGLDCTRPFDVVCICCICRPALHNGSCSSSLSALQRHLCRATHATARACTHTDLPDTALWSEFGRCDGLSRECVSRWVRVRIRIAVDSGAAAGNYGKDGRGGANLECAADADRQRRRSLLHAGGARGLPPVRETGGRRQRTAPRRASLAHARTRAWTTSASGRCA